MKNITVKEVKERIDSGEKVNLLDVREPAERDEYNIGGFFIPLGKIKQLEIDEIEDLKDQELICYCRSGGRSGQACQILEQLGFKNTKNLVGGMEAYKMLK